MEGEIIMGYEYLEHPSDIIVLAKNLSFEKTFEDVALSMFEHMGGPDATDIDSIEIPFKEKTIEQLVVQLLTQIIAECETLPLTPKRLEVSSFQLPATSEDEYTISVRIFGEKKIPENIIKAVTYNSLRIENKGNNWEIEILFDI